MSRRGKLQLDFASSDDGTRCAAECPHRDVVYDGCEDPDAKVIGYACERFSAMAVMGHERRPACIAAEQAAASVPSCEGARGLDASEALREARVQGMREGLSIAKGHARAVRTRYHIEVEYEDADEAVEAAIEAVRKGER